MLAQAATNVLHAVNIIAVGIEVDDSDRAKHKRLRGGLTSPNMSTAARGFEVLAHNLARKLLPTHADGAQVGASDAQ